MRRGLSIRAPLLLLLSVPMVSGRTAAQADFELSATVRAPSLTDLDAREAERVQRRADARFTIDAPSRRAWNAPHAMELRFGHAMQIALGEHRVALRLSELRLGRVTQPIPASEPHLSRNVATYHHEGGIIDEWYVNGPLGIQHGFDLRRRLSAGPVELVVAVTGSLRPAAVGRDVVLQASNGAQVLRYGEPHAWDSTGRPLPATVTVRLDRIVLRVDDTKAVYPVHVDPLIWREQATIVDSVPAPGALFGWSGLALSGDRLAIGGYEAGAVAVHRRAGTAWPLEQRIVRPSAADEWFGFTVALDGDTLAVSAARADTAVGADAGVVYVFVYSGGSWALQAALVPSGAGAGHRFGAHVALQGDTLIASSCDAPSDVSDSGSVYVFERRGSVWTETARLSPTGAEGRDCFFGASLGLDGGWLAVGIPEQRDMVGDYIGTVFLFERTAIGWLERQRLDSSAPRPSGRFGGAVDLAGDVLLVGQGGVTTAWEDYAGESFVYRRDGAVWREEAMLLPTPAGRHDQFGGAVAITGDRLAVGAPGAGDDGALVDPGRAFVFTRVGDAWALETTLTPPLPASRTVFGIATAGAPGLLAVTALQPDRSGMVYIYALRSEDGDACSVDDDCHSGFCVDGVCCDSACGAGALDDCMACSVAAGAASDGACGPVSAGYACRPVGGACDVEEVCDGAATGCPADAHLDGSVVCREAVGPCDREERCTGTSAACPADARSGAEVVCRASSAPCDAEERCDGASAECPTDALAGEETVCRASAFPCDAEERCDGASLACPADALSPDGASCTDGLACNGGETCLDAMCVPGAPLACDDGDDCTIDSCAEPDGCVHERVCCRLDAECEDGDQCTIDACEGARCVRAVAPGCDAGPDLDGGRGDGGPVFATWGCGCRAIARARSDAAAWMTLLLLGLALAARRR